MRVDMNALGVAHNACSDLPWTRGWTNAGAAPFHPTPLGAAETAKVISSAIRLLLAPPRRNETKAGRRTVATNDVDFGGASSATS
jgi:hypothetical protein